MAPTFFCGCSAGNWLDTIRDDALTYSLFLLSALAFAFAVRFRLRFTNQQRRLKLLGKQISALPKERAW
ncbi:hypothetical protein [Haloferula sp. BvORR071]|uniref:hypothetical protein n=1 Tax=Haloferula sp. BvORR071 TaxID=1396141 RepID=UPI0022410295|nr:hypothetical protein [Haloferula sp. BvORR071]